LIAATTEPSTAVGVHARTHRKSSAMMTAQPSHIRGGSPTMVAMRDAGPIELVVPPDASLARVLRLAASGIASLADFSVDGITDVKIAVNEVFMALIDHGRGEAISLRMAIDNASFRISGTTSVNGLAPDHPDLVLCETVLAGVSREHGISISGDQARIWAVIAALAVT
jgi:hypothetical protein